MTEEAEEGRVAVLRKIIGGEGRQPADARKTGRVEEVRPAVDGEMEPAHAATGAGRLGNAQGGSYWAAWLPEPPGLALDARRKQRIHR